MPLDGKSGFPDGMRVDTEGNLWVGAGWVGPVYDGVQIFAPTDGARIGQIMLPETIAEHGMPALKGSFSPLDRSADIFTWDPI